MNGSIATTTIQDSYDYSLEDEESAFLADDKILLNLRYYSRHILPIFCIFGIIGNCMALILIR